MDLPEHLDVEVELTLFMRRTRIRTLREILEIHPKLDYSSYLFLVAIHDAPDGIRASELADAFQVHKSTVSRAVAGLESMGLVERGPDPADGRAQLLVATAEARSGMGRFRESAHRRIESALEGWTQEQRDEFAGALARLNASVVGQ